MVPDSFIQDLKMKSDIVDLVSSYTNLKKHGRNYIGLCPFHNEKTASFYLYPDSGSFYCFGCACGGDIITFAEKAESLDYIDAVKFLAQRAGLSVPEDNLKDDYLSKLRMRIYEINRISARFFYEKLYSHEGKDALLYLKKRGLSDGTIRRFGLGFSPNSRFELVNFLKGRGFSYEEIIQANVALATRSGNAIDRFSSRVMFPIIDQKGNVIAFGGRSMDPNNKAKYLNTSDTPVFKKSGNLFALNFAKNQKDESFILVEGYMDVIALNQAGFKNTVATLGTALTIDQARLMARYKNEVIVCYDSDNAGQKAASRAIDILRSVDLLVKVLAVPKGKDPDEFIRSYGNQGYVRFKQLITNSQNDIEYSLKKSLKAHNIQSADGKVAYIKDAVFILSKISNPLERDVYASKLADFTGVDKTLIINQVKKNRAKYYKSSQKKEFKKIQEDLTAEKDFINPQKKQNLRAAIAEETLIAYIMNNPENSGHIFLKLPYDKFITDFNKRVYECLLNRIKNNRGVTLTDLTQDFKNDEISRISKFLASYNTDTLERSSINEYINIILSCNDKVNLEKSNYENAQLIHYINNLKQTKK